MRGLIVGPVLEDVQRADFRGGESVLATAFYSRQPLERFEVSGGILKLLVRLNIADLREWVDGVVDPEALLAFVNRLEAANVTVDLRHSRDAHAKAYLGRRALLIGSANFTAKGLSGRRHEILWRETGTSARASARARLNDYAADMTPMSTLQLGLFVTANLARVRRLRTQRRRPIPSEDIADLSGPRPPRLGTYEQFVAWVAGQPGDAASVISQRANGVGQLTGHVRACFYGVRQLLIADPEYRRRLLTRQPESYRVFVDPDGEARVKAFVNKGAVDEPNFLVEIWRTYLPIDLGGRAGNRGGCISTLNRMLPLLSRYLDARLA